MAKYGHTFLEPFESNVQHIPGIDGRLQQTSSRKGAEDESGKMIAVTRFIVLKKRK